MAPLYFPVSDNTVRVRMIDTQTSMSLHTSRFMEPELAGFETLNLTSVCFLIENKRLGKKLLFDCGARQDFENYSPTTKARLNAIIKGLKIEADVPDILEKAGIELVTINSVIWSHWHWDHQGAPEKFPPSVEIVVGPDFRQNFLPGWPTNPDAPLLDSNFENRVVREISFSNTGLTIGRFPALDFFGDGSFYLLDCPGHAIGHICGLARTTSSTYIFMGGDICHFSGMFRPSTRVRLPDSVPQDQLDDWFPSPCPCSLVTSQHPLADADSEEAKSSPFFHVTSNLPSSYHDRATAIESIERMQDFDASPNVLVCIAHDPTLLKILPLLNDKPNDDLNQWQSKGYKEWLLWGWLNELPKDGMPGRPMLVDGTWKSGAKVTDFSKLEPSN